MEHGDDVNSTRAKALITRRAHVYSTATVLYIKHADPGLVLGFLGTLKQRNWGAKSLVHDTCCPQRQQRALDFWDPQPISPRFHTAPYPSHG